MAVDIEEIAQLLSRLEVNFSNILGNYFDIFYSDVAQDVTLEYYDEEGILQTIQVPNRAKYFMNIQSGNGSPEGNKTGNIGATYQDLENGKFYIKRTSFEITEGWKELATVDDMNNLITKASGIPEGYYTAPMGTIYVNLLDGSVWVKQTASGNTGWVKIFSDDFATRQLDNLDEYGLDKLRTSNMYITGETQTADTIGYEQLEWMYHSTLDVSKFTTEGQPVINNDGSVTRLDYGEATPGPGEQENYVLIPNSFFDVGDNPWRLEWAGIMNHQSTSVSYMFGNDSTRENINSFINVYRGASSNNLYFNLATNTGGASGIASNVNIEGTLVDTDRVLSGFSNVNYANLPDTFAPQTQNWEFNTYITTGTDVTTKQTIVGSSNKQYSPFKIEISGGKFVLSVSLTDEELIGTVTGSDSLEVETGYYIRLVYNSAQYVLSFKKNIGDNWIDTATISSTNKVYSSANPQAILSLGVQYSNSTLIYPFFGSIDLTKSNIIIANSNTWTGTYRTGTPTFSDTIFVTFDPIYEGKEFRAYINYEGLSTDKYTFAIRFKNDDNTWTDWLIKNTTLSGRTIDIGESNLPFGYRYGWDETLKLNYLKIYVNEGSGLEPRNSLNKVGVDTLTNGKSVQYVESITGSKVVNVFYKDIVNENYEIEGVSEYYVIDEIAREVYLPMGELYGMIFRKPSKVDIPERTSQLINDSGFITSNLVYCVENGNSNANGILDIVDYTPSQGGSASQDVKLVYGPGTYTLPLNFESTTNCTIEAISGGAGGRVFDGIIVGYRATFFYKSGASGAYFKGNINLNAGNYEIVVGSGGVGQYNWMGVSGGSTSFGLSGGTNYLSISGGYCGGTWLDVGSPGAVGSYTGFIGNPRILNGGNGGWLITQDYTYSSTGWVPIPNISNPELGNPELANYGKGGRSLAPYYPYVADKGNYMRGTDGYFSISYTIPASQGKVGYVNYKVSPENPLTIIKKNGTKATITSINTDLLDSLELGLYNKFVDETGSELLKNTIYSQRPEPTNPQNNDVWIKFGEPLEVYKYVNGGWVEYNKVPIASFFVTIVDEVGTKGIREGSIINAKFFDNKFLLNASSLTSYVIESFYTPHTPATNEDPEIPEYWYRVYSDGWCEQGGMTRSGSNVTFTKEYKDVNYNLSGLAVVGYVSYGNITTNSVSFTITNGDLTNHPWVKWEAKGYLK